MEARPASSTPYAAGTEAGTCDCPQEITNLLDAGVVQNTGNRVRERLKSFAVYDVTCELNRLCHIASIWPETTAPRTRETAGEIASPPQRGCRAGGPGSGATCRWFPQVSRSRPTCGDFWRFRSDFPTDACDPPLAIVRLRSSCWPNTWRRSNNVELKSAFQNIYRHDVERRAR